METFSSGDTDFPLCWVRLSRKLGHVLPATLLVLCVSTGRVEYASVLGCGVIGWLPARNTGGDIQHYIICFFTGDSWDTTATSERKIQYFYFSPDRHFAKAATLPSDCNTRLYARAYYVPIVCLLFHRSELVILLGWLTIYSEKCVVAGTYSVT